LAAGACGFHVKGLREMSDAKAKALAAKEKVLFFLFFFTMYSSFSYLAFSGQCLI